MFFKFGFRVRQNHEINDIEGCLIVSVNIRVQGWECKCLPAVAVAKHAASASKSPAARRRSI